MLGKLNSFQIERLLMTQRYGHLGCHADGQTYVVPISYVYIDGKIFSYTIKGKKVEMMRKNPDICLQVESVEDASHWQSVIVWGKYRELSGREADDAARIFTSRFNPFRNSSTNRPKHGLEQAQASYTHATEMVAFEITVSEMSGRFEKDH